MTSGLCTCFSVIAALFGEFLSVLQRRCLYAAVSEGMLGDPSGLPVATPFPGIPPERLDV